MYFPPQALSSWVSTLTETVMLLPLSAPGAAASETLIFWPVWASAWASVTVKEPVLPTYPLLLTV